MNRSMECARFTEFVPEWSFGPPSPSLAAHLGDCAFCRAAFEDFAAIQSAAALLAEAEPPDHLWISIRFSLRQEGLISPAAARRSRFSPFFGWMPSPALGVAYASLLICSTFLLGSQTASMNRALWTAGFPATASTSSVDTQMRSVEQGSVTAAMHSPSPTLRASLSNNLSMINHYIALCRKSVQDSPQSEVARDYLYGAYQQKAELLADMADHGMDAR
jgi:hypothetical protein